MNRLEQMLMPLWVKPPQWIGRLYPNTIWQVPDIEQSIYLTFDDGPTPHVTEWVLEKLEQYQAKATFFCIGKHAALYPQLLEQVLSAGHSVGNHTYHHLNGWDTSVLKYAQDIQDCADFVPSTLFRPPYGKITRSQIRYLIENPSVCKQTIPPKIVMWTVISADWNKELPWQRCLDNVIQNINLRPNPYSPIVVFHDSLKAFGNLQQILPRILEYYAQNNFAFKALYF
mgnify:CR=1 FL=1|jgi:peptidoglycan/xylan/chitin deacetylase (PgdA/CDA1 family)